MFKRTYQLVGILVLVSTGAVRADHESEKSKIYNRFEIVSFGETQSLKGNFLRSLESMGEYFGYDLDNESVYKKRFDTLKLHYDDAREKFRKADVDTKKEPIYFGAIDWNTYTTTLGVKHWEDHRIQFYVAARKKGRKKDKSIKIPEAGAIDDLIENPAIVIIENAEAGRVLDYGDHETDLLQVYIEEDKNNKYQKWIVPSNWQSADAVGIGNAHINYLLDYNDENGRIWAKWDAYLQSPGETLNRYQKWRLVSVGDGLFLIENIHSGRVLDFHDRGDRKWRVYLEEKKATAVIGINDGASGLLSKLPLKTH